MGGRERGREVGGVLHFEMGLGEYGNDAEKDKWVLNMGRGYEEVQSNVIP